MPFGSQCELSTNIACFGIFCLNHTISVYYGNDTSLAPIRSGNIGYETRLSFGVPSECLTKVLGEYSSSIFDLSSHQGQAASILSNDLSNVFCYENPQLVLERYGLTVLNASMHFKSSNWEPYQVWKLERVAAYGSCHSFRFGYSLLLFLWPQVSWMGNPSRSDGLY